MALPARALDNLSPQDPASTWVIGIEVDLATALALARASTKALLELSPLAHREITAALEHEIQVLGYAYCQWFKPRPAYRYSAEDSIYLHPEAAGKGLGKRLLGDLMARAEAADVRKLIAVIGDSANAGSIGVHRALGFTPVGTIANCGWKFDRWLDIVLMEKVIGAGSSTAPGSK